MAGDAILRDRSVDTEEEKAERLVDGERHQCEADGGYINE